jgi:nitrogen fixation NifU-like protein
MSVMSQTLDDFVHDLEQLIEEEAKAAYGETVFERWQHIIHMGRMDDPDGHAYVRGLCGDAMEIFLRFQDDRVVKASFQTDGCGASAVCGSFAAELAHGKNPDELLEITGESLMERLGGLPQEERHCAFLAAEAVQEALNDYMVKAVRAKDQELNEDR